MTAIIMLQMHWYVGYLFLQIYHSGSRRVLLTGVFWQNVKIKLRIPATSLTAWWDCLVTSHLPVFGLKTS